jgi:Uma2 family endonuclease
MDKTAFLAWANGREGRYELAENHVVMMVGVSNAHSIITGNLFALLRGQIDRTRWTVHADFGVDVGPRTLRYPDVMIATASKSYGDFTAAAPALIVEVLSPSTTALDLGDKVAEYLELPTLMAYLVFAQDEPKAWVRLRSDTGFPSVPTVILGRNAVIDVLALGVSIKHSEVYEGIDEPEED